MAFKVFAANATLTAADVNDYLMEQSVIVCTSGTRPGSPAEGWTIYETDTNLYKHYDGSGWVTLVQPGAWTTHVPVLSVLGTTNLTLDAASTSRYCRHGRMIHWHGYAKIDAAAGATGNMYLTLPVAAEASIGWTIGIALGYDSSSNVSIPAMCSLVSSTYMAMQYVAGTGPSGTPIYFYEENLGAGDLPWQWSVDDIITWSVTYEASA